MNETMGQDGALLPVPVEITSLPQRDFRAGTAALAEMPSAEFDARLQSMRRGRERVTQIHRELMDAESDYGVIPGTQKPTLLKPGAEKLCEFYRLAAEFRPAITYGDSVMQPPITVVTECRLHLGTLDGPVVNTGHGAANSWERRYRYRRGDRVCPKCGREGALLKSKKQGEGWFCWTKKGGCGATFAERAPEIVNQAIGDVETTDPYDLLNTLLKMAEKRAYVDATLRATATSGLYTQDMEELQHGAGREMEAPERSAPAVRPAAKQPEAVEAPVVCAVDGCGVILTEDEITGSVMRGREFSGRILCTDHGKRALAEFRANSATTEAPDPFADV